LSQKKNNWFFTFALTGKGKQLIFKFLKATRRKTSAGRDIKKLPAKAVKKSEVKSFLKDL